MAVLRCTINRRRSVYATLLMFTKYSLNARRIANATESYNAATRISYSSESNFPRCEFLIFLSLSEASLDSKLFKISLADMFVFIAGVALFKRNVMNAKAHCRNVIAPLSQSSYRNPDAVSAFPMATNLAEASGE